LRIARERVGTEEDLGRDFETGEVLRHVTDDLFCFDHPSRTQDDDGRDLFSHRRVGNAHDGAVGDIGVLEDRGLDDH